MLSSWLKREGSMGKIRAANLQRRIVWQVDEAVLCCRIRALQNVDSDSTIYQASQAPCHFWAAVLPHQHILVSRLRTEQNESWLFRLNVRGICRAWIFWGIPPLNFGAGKRQCKLFCWAGESTRSALFSSRANPKCLRRRWRSPRSVRSLR